jgi:NOP5NT (NUC127) domain
VLVLQTAGRKLDLIKNQVVLGSGEMLLLFETAAGYGLFKVLNEGKLKETQVGRKLSVC